MLISLIFGLFGLIVGSFLNVLILRHGKLYLGGRSQCTNCGKAIAAIDLIPVLSWLLLRGRCRMCGGRISIQYPLVEASTAILFALVGAAPLPLMLQLFALPIVSLLIAIAVYDLYHTIIPDLWVYVFSGLGLVASLSAVTETYGYAEVFLGGPLTAAPLFALWLFSGGRWMGLGDAKFALGMGWLLGPWDGLVSLFLAFILGALISVPLLFMSSPLWKKMGAPITPKSASPRTHLAYTMKSEIPFGPFLIASCLVVWFIQIYGIPLPQFFA